MQFFVSDISRDMRTNARDASARSAQALGAGWWTGWVCKPGRRAAAVPRNVEYIPADWHAQVRETGFEVVHKAVGRARQLGLGVRNHSAGEIVGDGARGHLLGGGLRGPSAGPKCLPVPWLPRSRTPVRKAALTCRVPETGRNGLEDVGSPRAGVGHAHTSLVQEVEIARLRKDNGRRPAILWLGQGIEARQWIERASARQSSVGPLEQRISQTALRDCTSPNS